MQWVFQLLCQQQLCLWIAAVEDWRRILVLLSETL
jgi:hypothetical protein